LHGRLFIFVTTRFDHVGAKLTLSALSVAIFVHSTHAHDLHVWIAVLTVSLALSTFSSALLLVEAVQQQRQQQQP